MSFLLSMRYLMITSEPSFCLSEQDWQPFSRASGRSSEDREEDRLVSKEFYEKLHFFRDN